MKKKVAIITGKEVHNKNTYLIYKEFLSRNIMVDLYATTFDDGHLGLFIKDNVIVHDVKELSVDKINQYNYIITSVSIFEQKLFRNCKRYIFMNPSTHLLEVHFSGDFNFTAHDYTKRLVKSEELMLETFNNKKCIPAMATGGASLIYEEGKNNDNNIILFVDAGHYPFGTKKELVEYIIQIAEYCRDYIVRVKPRYLPGDVNKTHKNDDNIYNYFSKYSNLPSNLELIYEHTDLKEELRKCSLVICPEGTTSFEEVILSQKKLLIFTGFPNMENALWSEKRIQLSNQIPYNLPNRVYYKDIFKYLPYGIETNTDMLNDLLYSIKNNAYKIVEVMEYIDDTFLSVGRFPQHAYYKYENYKEELKESEKDTWENIIQERFKKVVYDNLSYLISRIYTYMDCSEVFLYVDSQNYSEENLYEKIEFARGILFKIIIENRNKMEETRYTQSILCLALYKTNMYEDLLNLNVKCNDYYNYCLAKIAYDRCDYVGALRYINEYFKEVEMHQFEVSLADDISVINMAHFYCGASYFAVGDYVKARFHLKICNNAWEGNHKKASELLDKIERYCN